MNFCNRTPAAMAGEAVPSPGTMPQIIAFDNEEFLGDHIHIFGNMKDLGRWGNSISSLVILSGTWEFFDDEVSDIPKGRLTIPGWMLIAGKVLGRTESGRLHLKFQDVYICQKPTCEDIRQPW
jgi:hypothetical protein